MHRPPKTTQIQALIHCNSAEMVQIQAPIPQNGPNLDLGPKKVQIQAQTPKMAQIQFQSPQNGTEPHWPKSRLN